MLTKTTPTLCRPITTTRTTARNNSTARKQQERQATRPRITGRNLMDLVNSSRRQKGRIRRETTIRVKVKHIIIVIVMKRRLLYTRLQSVRNLLLIYCMFYLL